MSLRDQLEELTTKLRALVPAERLAVVDRAADELKSSGTADRALKAGDSAPAFELPDGDGMIWRSAGLLQRGPPGLVFYLGRWWAHFNTPLETLPESPAQNAAAGAFPVAGSPPTPK